MTELDIEKHIQALCADIPHSMLDLHRIFVKLGDTPQFKIIKKTNIDECSQYEDWYEYCGNNKIRKSTPRSVLVSSDTTIEKYSNVDSFIDACCIKSPDSKIKHAVLYKRYSVWCQTSRVPIVEIRVFIKSLKKMGYVLKTDIWHGVGFI